MADRKQNRVRIDAITNAIRKGEYDDKLKDLREAIDARMNHKRQEVLSMVQEVYGDNFVVAAKRGFATGGLVGSPEVVFQSASRGIPVEDEPVKDPLGDDPEGEFESRSPIIGSGNPG